MPDFAAHTSRIIDRLGESVQVDGWCVHGVFSNGSGNSFDLVAGTQPNLLVKSADVPDIVRGAGVVVGDDRYTITDIKPDGTGMTRLILEAV